MSVLSLSTPWGVLLNKKESKLAAGAITRGATLRPSNRSRYNRHGASPMVTTPLGMGYVEAALGVLLGIVGPITYDAGANVGRVTLRSTGGSSVYAFSWRVEAERVILGGFAHSDGQPTYQAAIVALIQLVALHRCSPTSQSAEVIERWYALVDAMEVAAPRANADAGWPARAIAEAVATDPIRDRLEQFCDALLHAMRYRLPELPASEPARLIERGMGVTAADPLTADAGRALMLPGSVLINPSAARAIVREPERSPAPDSPPTAPSTPGEAAMAPAVRPTARVTRRSAGAAAPAAEPTANPEPPDPPLAEPASPSPTLRGAHLARVQRALATARGPLMLIGPTATGKTTLALHAARALDWGVEVMVCDPGVDALEPFGGYARRTAAEAPLAAPVEQSESEDAASALPRLPRWARPLLEQLRTERTTAEARLAALEAREHGGEWVAIDGPIARWARRAIAGTPMLLVIDELARGHESLIAAIMRVLNTFDRNTLTRQGLTVPPGAEGSARFHIVDLWHTRERLVVPADQVKILATANLGERYSGLDLADPAFRRRWSGGWLYLGAYQPDTVGEILADTLGLPATAPLIAKLKIVAVQVEEYQRAEDRLLATLDLATMIAWGQAVVQLAALPGMGVARAWAESAGDVWIERVCSMKGTELDPDARTALTRIVTSHTPMSIR